jgi:putative phosphotransacetylase
MSEIKVIIEGSGKHCHVTRETLDELFGQGFELEVKKYLSQPGQFATPHKVTVIGPKGKTDIVIVGPCRRANQVELSFTDARALGLNNPPVRESGDVAGSPGVKLVGPVGEVDIPEGAIVAKRHVHLTPEDAAKFGIADKQIVKVRVGGDRALIFDEVVARVSPEYATFMHIDYDEINAAALFDAQPVGVIIL